MCPVAKSKTAVRYKLEFKESAVKLALEGHDSYSKTARDLGININTLHSWIRIYGSKEKKSETFGDCEAEELKQLRKELKRVREERDILKKATAYFAKETL